ncbi:hypothetical protein Cob_v001463 [Colletotrichum orbiculare MAFF 240422]|uniref:Uncharacterized protein n=1 Tax=Colletotrichum orbiculare (strain 104-T / ATCC 96160 / CBS 514.97 / LARS 414 / MAFF 240422) TaxID=1213857 RepID=A0A484G6V8_COLOR|nr:hypothetical protein Cob_v001463 [Colletotrichum orbiculare MAFF 240422]
MQSLLHIFSAVQKNSPQLRSSQFFPVLPAADTTSSSYKPSVQPAKTFSSARPRALFRWLVPTFDWSTTTFLPLSDSPFVVPHCHFQLFASPYVEPAVHLCQSSHYPYPGKLSSSRDASSFDR